MKVLVVYDSNFGNNEKIAKVLEKEIGKKHQISICHVNYFKETLLSGVDLLIIGSPTHAFHPTKAIKHMIRKMDSSMIQSMWIGLYDTRLDMGKVDLLILKVMKKLRGSAVGKMKQMLLKKNAKIKHEINGFIVSDKEGPVKSSEWEKIKSWANQLVESEADIHD